MFFELEECTGSLSQAVCGDQMCKCLSWVVTMASMASRKGQGNKKGKKHAKNCAASQVLPPQSSSKEESWPIWQQLQDKILALEAERVAQKAQQLSRAQPHHSAREAKSHRTANLKAMADKLMSQFAALEADWQPPGSSGRESEESEVMP